MKIISIQASKPFQVGFILVVVAFALLNLYSLHQNSTGGLEGVLGLHKYYDATVRWGYPFQVREVGGFAGRDETHPCALLLNLLLLVSCGYIVGSIFDRFAQRLVRRK